MNQLEKTWSAISQGDTRLLRHVLRRADGKPMTIDALMAESGISRVTLWRWEKARVESMRAPQEAKWAKFVFDNKKRIRKAIQDAIKQRKLRLYTQEARA